MGGLVSTRGDGLPRPPAVRGRKGSQQITERDQRWVGRLARYCWRYPGPVALALGGALLASLTSLVTPLIQRDIVNNAILSHRQPIWLGATALIIAAALGFAGVFTRRYLGSRVSLDVQHDLRTEMFAALSRL